MCTNKREPHRHTHTQTRPSPVSHRIKADGNKIKQTELFVVASDTETVVMRSMIVVLVMTACVAVICETAAISKQQRRHDDDVTRWLPSLTNNKRYIIPTIKHLVNEQKRRDDDDDETRWLSGLTNNKRYIIPTKKHLANEQKHRRTVSRNTGLVQYPKLNIIHIGL